MAMSIVWGITEVVRRQLGWSEVDQRQVDSSEDSLG